VIFIDEQFLKKFFVDAKRKGIEFCCGDNPYKPQQKLNEMDIKILHTDKSKGKFVEMILDCEKQPLPFPNNYFELVVIQGGIEHLNDIYAFMDEVYRILKKGGIFYCDTPHFSNPFYYWELDHKHNFHSRSFHSWTEDFGDTSMNRLTKGKFKIVWSDYSMRFGKIIKPILGDMQSRRFQIWEEFFSRWLSYVVFMYFRMKKI